MPADHSGLGPGRRNRYPIEGADARGARPHEAQAASTATGTSILFRMPPARVLYVLLGLVVILAGTSLAAQFMHHSGHPLPMTLVERLDLDQENNIPTWFSSVVLATAALLLFFIARANAALGMAYSSYWAGLGLIFLYLSVDETASLHEAAGTLVQRLLGTSGALYSAWVIPAMVLVVIFAAIYLRFLWALPRRTAALFVLAGALYVGGALGLELIGWHYRYPMHALDPTDWQASKDFTYALINHAEEFLEMTGVILFIYALLSYVASHHLAMVVRFPTRRVDESAPLLHAAPSS